MVLRFVIASSSLFLLWLRLIVHLWCVVVGRNDCVHVQPNRTRTMRTRLPLQLQDPLREFLREFLRYPLFLRRTIPVVSLNAGCYRTYYNQTAAVFVMRYIFLQHQRTITYVMGHSMILFVTYNYCTLWFWTHHYIPDILATREEHSDGVAICSVYSA
jgi:hypothetical protein